MSELEKISISFFLVIGVVVIGIFKIDPSLNVSCNYYSPLGGLRAGP